MKTAKENIALLPDQCFGVLLTDKSLIKIKAGESGYYPLKHMSPSAEEMMKRYGFKTMEGYCNDLNKKDGVTLQQRKAMEWGSQFGWETRLADPTQWTEDGTPHRELEVPPLFMKNTPKTETAKKRKK